MKTEEILNSNASVPKPQLDGVINAMKEYAAQELANYKAKLKEEIKGKQLQVDPFFWLAYRDVLQMIDND